ncbi:ABC-type sugar transport system, permease component [Paenibacillus polysaccharolyticus]|jgi:ABC-type sugar transport system permease subunit|uniref:Sugar ABC transporter permease n=3 Tax=Paenibacillus TaxID=44249 RepID=A0A5M9WZV8_PAEAM|nr:MULTISPECIES: sugar ABC transporter permease [Paenibacillus]MDP9698316.1 ABC-type sugar transport system permease subunit [Paenibacillus intestini]KAA8787072.1 sugar ABC transporter permease [Paenibacillus amylolyticus]MBY0206547.1 sugar ABC transporter permease [Paenibacillus cucumis (ex Kampfer et al. 2016)]MCM3132148.1 sugar ABC transporter permease [Paenibacillus polysaccharolyticus]MDT0122457.1 sugar ABC transporter permease [Paenibacillus sp. RRE4]
MKLKKLSLEQKNRYYGLYFILPWFIGFLLLFMVPLISSFRYSLSNLQVSNEGFTLEFIGLANFREALFSHESYVRMLTESVINIVVNTPLIIIFSLFFAVILNQKFHGRVLARAIFFLPVILASGIIASIENGDLMQSVVRSANDMTGGGLSVMKNLDLTIMLLESGMSPILVEYLTGAVSRIYEIVSQSGVQILIFLAGLQSISPSLYEAAKIEGSTGYEAFWKITFPMLSPLILTNLVYTIVDSFISDQTSRLVVDTAFKSFNFGLSAAMSWMYFAVIALILWVTTALVSRKVFYQN